MKAMILVAAAVLALLPATAMAKVYVLEGCSYPGGSSQDSTPNFIGPKGVSADISEEQYDQIHNVCGWRDDAPEERCCRMTFEGRRNTFIAPAGTEKGQVVEFFTVDKVIKVEMIK